MLCRGSGWQVGMWFRLDMQGSSKKSWKGALIQNILSYWMCPSWQKDLDLHGWRWKDCHGRKCVEVTSTVECVRLSESGRIWHYRYWDLRRKNPISISLWLSASYYSTDTPLQYLPLLVVYMVELDSLDCLTQKRLNSFPWHDSSVLIFQFPSIWLLFSTLVFGQGFFSTGKKKPRP